MGSVTHVIKWLLLAYKSDESRKLVQRMTQATQTETKATPETKPATETKSAVWSRPRYAVCYGKCHRCNNELLDLTDCVCVYPTPSKREFYWICASCETASLKNDLG